MQGISESYLITFKGRSMYTLMQNEKKGVFLKHLKNNVRNYKIIDANVRVFVCNEKIRNKMFTVIYYLKIDDNSLKKLIIQECVDDINDVTVNHYGSNIVFTILLPNNSVKMVKLVSNKKMTTIPSLDIFPVLQTNIQSIHSINEKSIILMRNFMNKVLVIDQSFYYSNDCVDDELYQKMKSRLHNQKANKILINDFIYIIDGNHLIEYDFYSTDEVKVLDIEDEKVPEIVDVFLDPNIPNVFHYPQFSMTTYQVLILKNNELEEIYNDIIDAGKEYMIDVNGNIVFTARKQLYAERCNSQCRCGMIKLEKDYYSFPYDN